MGKDSSVYKERDDITEFEQKPIEVDEIGNENEL